MFNTVSKNILKVELTPLIESYKLFIAIEVYVKDSH